MQDYFRNCKHCGFGFFQNQFTKVDFFCNRCWFKIEREKAPLLTAIYKTPQVMVRPLYIWKAKENIVGSLIHGLKDGEPQKIIDRLGVEMCMRFFTKKEIVIAPVPSSKVGEKDHAYRLAKIVSETLDCPLWEGLVWKNKTQNQKFLNKTERFVNQMEKVQRLPPNRRVILIDDLVTTGATALAAQKAIKSLNQIEVWALACRI